MDLYKSIIENNEYFFELLKKEESIYIIKTADKLVLRIENLVTFIEHKEKPEEYETLEYDDYSHDIIGYKDTTITFDTFILKFIFENNPFIKAFFYENFPGEYINIFINFRQIKIPENLKILMIDSPSILDIKDLKNIEILYIDIESTMFYNNSEIVYESLDNSNKIEKILYSKNKIENTIKKICKKNNINIIKFKYQENYIKFLSQYKYYKTI